MDKAYIVYCEYHSEGAEICGVFSSQRLADECIKNFKHRTPHFDYRTVGFIVDKETSFEIG